MSKPLPKPTRILTSLELSEPARGTLCRLKQQYGLSYTFAVEKGLAALAEQYGLAQLPPLDTAAARLAQLPKKGGRK